MAAGHIKDQTSEFTLTVKLLSTAGEILQQADATPTAVVKDSGGATVATINAGSVSNPSAGVYKFSWAPTQTGTLTLTWSFLVSSTVYTKVETLVVFDVSTGTAKEVEIKTFIKRKLGYGVVAIELTDDQLQDAVDSAKFWWSDAIGHLRQGTLVTAAGEQEYAVADDVETVTEVVVESDYDVLSTAIGFPEIKISAGNVGINGGGEYHGIVQALQYRETAKRLLSADPDWDWDEVNKKLILSPIPTGAAKVVYYYLSSVIDVAALKGRDFEMVRQWALASAMETLGYIRTKYNEAPSASGGFSMNGDTLLNNADTIKMNLGEKIKGLRPVMPILTG